ncbi:uncharacterized protein EAF02_007883 [Botrytis sinoallii]|uniref:uncharacterized protein n=1 Tax=Botrytis sinoallii TaxID=1463999 RepID=UPI0019017A59|nr:uncharacterized protein EAF02_007883 [Botrytis sinoallii]KAF7879713.1 hypothetical protein EAF02_007883 [Botrytis sinoallii]
MANDSIRIDEDNAANFMAHPGSEHMSGAPATYPTSHLTGINESSVTDPSNPACPGPISRMPIGSTGGNTSSTRLPYYGVGMHPLLVNSTAESISSTRMPYHGVGMHPLLVDSTSGNASALYPTMKCCKSRFAQGKPQQPTNLFSTMVRCAKRVSSAQMTQNGLHMEVSLNFEDVSIPGLLNEVTATTQPISNNGMLRQNDSYAQVAQNDMSMRNLLDNGNESRVSLFNAFGENEFSELPELDFGNSTLHQDDPNPNLPNELTANEFAELPEVVPDNGMLHQDGLRPNLSNEVTAITEPVASKEAASITGQVANNEVTATTQSVAEDERPSQNDPVHKHGSVHNDGSADNLAEIRRSKADELTDRQERAIAALLIRFQNLVKLAALPTEDAFTKETAAAEGLRMEVESNALTSAAEDLLKLTRELKEFWIFGSLRGIGEGEGDGEMETDSKKVAELIEKQLEKKHEQEKNKA